MPSTFLATDGSSSHGSSTASLVVAIIAICVSAGVLVFNVWNAHRQRRHAREDARRDLFFRMHERMIDVEYARGRRIAFRLNSEADALALLEDDESSFDLANRALALFDIFAMYAEYDFIDRDMLVDEWRHQLRLVLTNGRFIGDVRRTRFQQREPWPHLMRLAVEVGTPADARPTPFAEGRVTSEQ